MPIELTGKFHGSEFGGILLRKETKDSVIASKLRTLAKDGIATYIQSNNKSGVFLCILPTFEYRNTISHRWAQRPTLSHLSNYKLSCPDWLQFRDQYPTPDWTSLTLPSSPASCQTKISFTDT
ncbi:hypothetical protein AVEN_262079-1 [Araneus ventricosus]|uniref:Uncharacterized protein n=1 Tax=Araneus ventricosus TaxID=182803 RepID=A0A4Y2X959_ARAVE|nr:hypothetical protein AVEN_262079-1 [Araneus ventricosus]